MAPYDYWIAVIIINNCSSDTTMAVNPRCMFNDYEHKCRRLEFCLGVNVNELP